MVSLLECLYRLNLIFRPVFVHLPDNLRHKRKENLADDVLQAYFRVLTLVDVPSKTEYDASDVFL